MKKILTFLACAGLSASVAADGADRDFGQRVEQLLQAQAQKLFGVNRPAPAFTANVSRAPGQKAGDLITLAHGLKATILTRRAGGVADMFAFWPNDSAPTHLVFCIEGGRQELEGDGNSSAYAPGDKYNPSVQRINVVTGQVETILRGMSACDGMRRTPWNTILATEEVANTGGAYEILNPLATTDHTVADRSSGVIVDAAGNTDTDEIAKRPALPAMSWEGLDITPEGVVYAGDERRPGSNYGGGNVVDSDGGAIFKFIPAVAWAGDSLADLSLSPFVSGSTYAYRARCSSSQYGQGCEIGRGDWVTASAAAAAQSADAAGATGYYRPEDGHFDPSYAGPGIRFCWTNTGNEGESNYGEVVCMTDPTPGSASSQPIANRFVEGDAQFNSVDNLEFQKTTGNMYVIEDHENGDIFACLPDGRDRDIKTDGCIRILSVKDQSAEPTGFAFTADGRTAYVSIQHSDDAACTAGTDCENVDGYATDDIVKITGWKRKD